MSDVIRQEAAQPLFVTASQPCADGRIQDQAELRFADQPSQPLLRIPEQFVMAEGLRRMTAAGMDRAIVGFDPNNAAALALYTSMGFRASADFVIYRKTLPFEPFVI